MRPRTKLQLQVAALSRKLPKITREHKNWVTGTLLPHYIYRTLKYHQCMKCGKSWKVYKEPRLSYLLDDNCPHCGAWLNSMPGKKRSLKDRHYFYIASVVEGFQLLRFFCVERRCKVGEKMKFDICEVCQHWITPKGKLTVMAIKRNFMGYFSSTPWVFGTEMEIRKDNDRYYEHGKCYPAPRYLKEIRRNGYKGSDHGLHPSWLFQLILSNPKAETLLKARQYGFLRLFTASSYLINELWPSIRICMRNNYIVRDASTWVDHIEMLKEAGKDILNAKYICPADLQAEHQKLIEKQNRIRRKEEAERLRKDIAKYNLVFKKEKSRFFGISFSTGHISVSVMEDVNEYYHEGKALNHCVFTSQYFKKKDTLCLSVKSRGKSLATVELSLVSWGILQCRSANNEVPKENSLIRQLVEENIHQFKKRIRVHRKSLTLSPAA